MIEKLNGEVQSIFIDVFIEKVYCFKQYLIECNRIYFHNKSGIIESNYICINWAKGKSQSVSIKNKKLEKKTKPEQANACICKMKHSPIHK